MTEDEAKEFATKNALQQFRHPNCGQTVFEVVGYGSILLGHKSGFSVITLRVVGDADESKNIYRNGIVRAAAHLKLSRIYLVTTEPLDDDDLVGNCTDPEKLVPVSKAPTVALSAYPGKCPACFQPAYIGMLEVSCSSISCRHADPAMKVAAKGQSGGDKTKEAVAALVAALAAAPMTQGTAPLPSSYTIIP